MKKDISIIIPTYNCEKTIQKTIMSCINQKYKNIEIIIINDGSKDNTEKILLDLQKEDNRIKYYNKINGGVSSARNFGVKHASGDLICFLDSDDLLKNDFIIKMKNQINNSKSDICYCGYDIFIKDQIKRINNRFNIKKTLEYYLMGKTSVQTGCWMIKRNLIERNYLKFDENLSWGEDIDFFVRLIKSTDKITCVEENLVLYNVEKNDNKLSKFDITKIDIDKNNIDKLLTYNLSKKEKKILINYRLPALIVYRLIDAFNQKIEINIIKNYYIKYKEDIEKVRFINGLRSIKLYYYSIKLKFFIKRGK